MTIFKAVAAVLLAVFVYYAFPIYGFVSHQYEIARSPFGWTSVPDEIPQDERLNDSRFGDEAQKALTALESRRAMINAPSMSAAVAIKGETVWAGAVGYENIANDIPASVDTKYRIGSTSKAVTSTGLARMVTMGKLALDEPISTYWMDLPNPQWENFTLRQLSSHTAGMPDYADNSDLIGLYRSMALKKRFEDPVSALSVVDTSDLLYQPGEEFHYAGFDNILISAVMQQAAGRPFDALMSEKVFDPLGAATIQPDYLIATKTNYATSYQASGSKLKPWRTVDLSHKLAAGGYTASPSDLVQLGSAWLDGGFISPSVREQFWAPVSLNNGEVNEQDYALGWRRKTWRVEGVGDIVNLNHGGVSKGAQCWLMVIPELEMVIAISTNRRTDEFFEFADVSVDLIQIFAPAAQQ